ncbi:MAG: tetratricopeptide repeat protein [Pirellulales bacterium]
MRRLCEFLLILGCIAAATGCITTSPKLALRWPGDLKREQVERSLSVARLHERQGKYDEAINVYKQVLDNDPKNMTAYHRLGAIAVKEGRLAEGRESFEKAASLGRPSAELLNDMGYLAYLQQDLPAAEAKMREALRTDSRYKNAHNNLGLVLAEMGKFDEALAEFKQVGSEAEAFSNLAYVQTKMGQLADAERNYHKALSLDNKLRPAAEALLQLADLKARATGTTSPAMIASQPSGMGVGPSMPNAGAGRDALIESVVDPGNTSAVRPTGAVPAQSPIVPLPAVVPTSGTESGGAVRIGSAADASSTQGVPFSPFGDSPSAPAANTPVKPPANPAATGYSPYTSPQANASASPTANPASVSRPPATRSISSPPAPAGSGQPRPVSASPLPTSSLPVPASTSWPSGGLYPATSNASR